MRVAIWGAGSLGTITGALMEKNGQPVDLITRNKAHVEALNKNGASITGCMELKNQPVHALMPDEVEGIYDIVFLLTKQTANAEVLPEIAKHMNEKSVICTLQNGAPEEFVASVIGKERTIGGVTAWGASYAAPGVSRLSSEPQRMVFELGEVDGSITPRLERVAGVLRKACDVHVVENLAGIRWSKLVNNGTMSGLSAALGTSFGGIIRDDRALTVAAYQSNEVIRTANAIGVKLEIVYKGWDFYDLLFEDAAGLEKAKRWLYEYFMPDDINVASMTSDMRAGKKCEVDYILGVIADKARKNGVAAPSLNNCIRIIKEFEAGRHELPMELSTLGEFSDIGK